VQGRFVPLAKGKGTSQKLENATALNAALRQLVCYCLFVSVLIF
jgi:hypothetical protein